LNWAFYAPTEKKTTDNDKRKHLFRGMSHFLCASARTRVWFLRKSFGAELRTAQREKELEAREVSSRYYATNREVNNRQR